MKRILRLTGYGVAAILLLITLAICTLYATLFIRLQSDLGTLGPQAPRFTGAAEGLRDLNKNGRLDIYENPAEPLDARIADLISQMTVAEKAGLMFITFTPAGAGSSLSNYPSFFDVRTLIFEGNVPLVAGKGMNHFSLANTVDDPEAFAGWTNAMQRLAERTRLGIPVTFATDPRHGLRVGSSVAQPAGAFSLWPDPLGLAATRDPALVNRFADIARQEYRAVGIHLALHPTADLATEPRWARIGGTFGEDAHLSAQMTAAYVNGLQGDRLGAYSVATMVKHWAGGGPQKDGEDAHFVYGKEQAYPGNNFDYHLIPFVEGALPAGTAQIMPYYGIPVGQSEETVGFAYDKYMITTLLRGTYGFDGVICTDWGLVTDAKLLGLFTVLPARAWGVEELDVEARVLKLLDAGVDQFGGEHIPEVLVDLVSSGRLPEERLDRSVRRILRDKFRLGLFDDPFVDVRRAGELVGNAAFMDAGVEAQRRSMVLLKNGTNAEPVLPLSGKLRLYLENVDAETAGRYAEVVDDPALADIALVRLDTPYEPRDGLLEAFMHAGDLDFKSPEKERLDTLMSTVPTIVVLFLERAAVIPEIAEGSAALIADFGATDKVVMDVIFGTARPTGRLPVELPSSMAAVRAQKEDVPYDSEAPLYPFGFGLEYAPDPS
ncbi:MAG: glycoside hydrolase family 3 N-terminal domain-containing protein [Parvularculales bacterium]